MSQAGNVEEGDGCGGLEAGIMNKLEAGTMNRFEQL